MADAIYTGLRHLSGTWARRLATPVLRSRLRSRGDCRCSLRVASPETDLCTVQQERQKEDDTGRDTPGPIHVIRVPPNPDGYNAARRFYHGLLYVRMERRPFL
jgi:hypothetical protein